MTTSSAASRRDFFRVAGVAAAGAFLAPSLLRAQATPPAADAPPATNAAKAVGAPAALDIRKLEDDFFMVSGAGGNISVHVTPDAALVVDAGLPDTVANVTNTLSSLIGSARRRILLNTHWHFDHIGANEALAAQGFTIIATDRCYRRLSSTVVFEDIGKTFEPLPESARPAVALSAPTTLHVPAEVTLTPFPPAHTDTDVTAHFEKYNIFVTGDLFFNNWFPVIDRSTGGSLDNMITATKKLLTLVNASTRIVPGHGPLASKADLQSSLSLLEEVHAKLAPFGEKQTPLEDVLKAAPLAYLDDKWGRGFLRSPLFTRMAYGQWLTKK